MANCVRCGRKLPAFSFGAASETCRACRKADGGQTVDAAIGKPRLARAALRQVTPATSVVIGINALVLAGMAITTKGTALIAPSNEVLLRWGADWGPVTFGREPWRAFSSMWVHAGIVHLFLNMWCLDTYGRLTERLFGWRFYVAIYVLAGLCGSIASLAWHPNAVSVGASAAVFGVVGALLLAFKMGKVPIPPQALKAAGKSLLVFVGYNLLIGVAIPAIDNAAHVGGLLGGFALGAMGARGVSDNRGRIIRGTALGAVMVISAFFAVRHFRVAATLARQAAHVLGTGRTDEAIDMATAAIAYDNRDAVAHAVLGSAYLRKNERDRAVEEFEKAIRMDPDYEYALAQLGWTYGVLDRFPDAVRVLERAVKLDKEDSGVWTNLGVAYARTGRTEEAVGALRTAMQQDPRNAFAHDALGIVLEPDQIDSAIESFRQAVRLQPENKEFMAHLADALDAKGLHEEAERVRRTAEPAK